MRVILLSLSLLVIVSNAWAEPSWDKLADAIYLAEGGAKTSHPYGILAKYKHTTPRQACLNTIKHKYGDWVKFGSNGDFIEYLGSKYAPINCANDPTGLNRNWVKNVKRLYRTGLDKYSNERYT